MSLLLCIIYEYLSSFEYYAYESVCNLGLHQYVVVEIVYAIRILVTLTHGVPLSQEVGMLV